MDERTTNEVVQDVMEDIAAKREEAMQADQSEKTLAEKFSEGKAEQAQPEAPAEDAKKMDEITLKFGKGCVGDEFQCKDGVKYREILVHGRPLWSSRIMCMKTSLEKACGASFLPMVLLRFTGA